MEPLAAVVPPPGWGKDELSNYFEVAHRNAYATFTNLGGPFQKFGAIDKLYRDLIANLRNTPDWFAAFFVLRAHSSYLAACRLAISGHLPETYMLLRGCLENALYGFYVAGRPELQETWLRRHDDADAMRAVKDQFQIGGMFRHLALANSPIADIAKVLYERTIDYGAHPNERALMQVLRMERASSDVSFELRYLTAATDVAFGLCLKSAAQVGVCALDIFRIVFQHRFEILGLTKKLADLKTGL